MKEAYYYRAAYLQITHTRGYLINASQWLRTRSRKMKWHIASLAMSRFRELQCGKRKKREFHAVLRGSATRARFGRPHFITRRRQTSRAFFLRCNAVLTGCARPQLIGAAQRSAGINRFSSRKRGRICRLARPSDGAVTTALVVQDAVGQRHIWRLLRRGSPVDCPIA